MEKKIIDYKQCEIFFTQVFKKIGVPVSIYRPVIDGLIETSLRGVDSHGIRLMPHYVKGCLNGRINIKPKFKFKKTSFSTAIMDADHSLGIAAGRAGMEKAIKMAKKSGIAAVAVKNSSHFGAAAIYSLMAANSNMIGLSFTNVEALVLPYGSKKPFVGTNPICFAAPIDGEDPFCLDMATPIITLNKLMMYKTQNKELEDNWAADEEGVITKNSAKAKFLLPIGGYKGYGLGLMIEILCGLLTGMNFGPHITPMYPLTKDKRKLGQFFIAINISKFENIKIFKKRMKELVNELRSLPISKGFEKVKVAGDPEKEFYKIRLKTGIPILKQEFLNFIEIARELKIENKYIEALSWE